MPNFNCRKLPNDIENAFSIIQNEANSLEFIRNAGNNLELKTCSDKTYTVAIKLSKLNSLANSLSGMNQMLTLDFITKSLQGINQLPYQNLQILKARKFANPLK